MPWEQHSPPFVLVVLSVLQTLLLLLTCQRDRSSYDCHNGRREAQGIRPGKLVVITITGTSQALGQDLFVHTSFIFPANPVSYILKIVSKEYTHFMDK